MLYLRRMEPTDTATVARIHADSWRSAYRGILRDEYLDHFVDDDRLALWQERLSQRAAAELGLIAVRGGNPVGFAYVLPNRDPA